MDLEAVRHYRGVTQLVLRWYLEPISGILCLLGSSRSVFDVRVLEFQHDVDTVMDRVLSPTEQAFLLLLHGDGLAPGEVSRLAPVKLKPTNPRLVARLRATFPDDSPTSAWLTQVAIETKLGRALTAAGLDRVANYFRRG